MPTRSNIIGVLVVFQFFASPLQAGPPNHENAAVFQITVRGSLDSVIEQLRQRLNGRGFDWSTVLYYWEVENSVGFMVSSKSVEGGPKLTSAQWFAVGLAELESVGVIKVDSSVYVVSGAFLGEIPAGQKNKTQAQDE